MISINTPMAAYIGNSDNEPGRRSRTIQPQECLRMCNLWQTLPKAIALVHPTGESCSSKADKETPCLFPAVKRNRGCCVVHGKGFHPLLKDKGGALMGPQFLRPETQGHRMCDCDLGCLFRPDSGNSEEFHHIPLILGWNLSSGPTECTFGTPPG